MTLEKENYAVKLDNVINHPVPQHVCTVLLMQWVRWTHFARIMLKLKCIG